MSEKTMSAANEAIFHLQLATDDAIRYVVRNGHCDPKTAGQALKEVMVGYKSR